MAFTPIDWIASYFGWTQFTPALPSFYWDVYSAEERVKKICFELHKLCEYANMLADNINIDHTLIQELQDALANIENIDEIDEQVQALQDAADAIQETLDALPSYEEFTTLDAKTALKPYVFNTVADMQECELLKSGDICETLGFNEISDGGGARYIIGSDTANGYSVIQCGDLTATIMVGNEIIPEQVGAVGDGVADDTAAMYVAFSFGVPVCGKKTYLLNGSGRTFENLSILGGSYRGTFSCIATNLNIVGCDIDGAYHFNVTQTDISLINNNTIRDSTGFIIANNLSDFRRIEVCNNNVLDFTHYILYAGQSDENTFNGDLVLVTGNTVRGHQMSTAVLINSYYCFVLAECKRIVFENNDCRNWSSVGNNIVCYDVCAECNEVFYNNNYMENVYSQDVETGSRYVIRAKNGNNGTRIYSNSKYVITADVAYRICRSQDQNAFVISNCTFDFASWTGSYTAVAGSKLFINNCVINANKATAPVFYTQHLHMSNTEINIGTYTHENNSMFRNGDTVLENVTITTESGDLYISSNVISGGKMVINNCSFNNVYTMGDGISTIKNMRVIHLSHGALLENVCVDAASTTAIQMSKFIGTQLFVSINGEPHVITFKGSGEGYTLDGVDYTDSQVINNALRIYNSGFYTLASICRLVHLDIAR